MDDSTIGVTLIMAAVTSGAHTIAEIASACGGLYPGELRDALDLLVAQGRISQSGDHFSVGAPLYATDLTQHVQPALVNEIPELPEPHPLDYDWRFDLSSTRRVAAQVSQASLPGRRILLLGAPSIFLELERMTYQVYPVLLDQSSELVEYLQRFSWLVPCMIVEHDLLSGLLWNVEHPVDVVLCDPPWYPEHYAAFLAQAAKSIRIGGMTFVSLLPLNTRETAIADRQQVLDIAHSLGFAINSLEPGALGYKTPTFEHSSLERSAIHMPGDWRHGDLLTLVKSQQVDERALARCLSFGTTGREDREWREILFGPYKVKLRGPFDDVSDYPALLTIEHDDILPTVSRRYVGRQRVDLWLWDNRVFAVKGRAAFLAALHALADRALPSEPPSVPEQYRDIACAELRLVLGNICTLASGLPGGRPGDAPVLLNSGGQSALTTFPSVVDEVQSAAVRVINDAVFGQISNLDHSDCDAGLHSFYNSRNRNGDGFPMCKYCGADVIDWLRLYQRTLSDIGYTFEALRREKVRYEWWTKEVDQSALNHALRKGELKLHEAVIARLRASIGKVHTLPDGTRRVYRDGYQTPLKGNSIYYAQHATACCCRKCIRCWHGIPVDRDLSDEEIGYFAELVVAFVRARLPQLTNQGQNVPRLKRS